MGLQYLSWNISISRLVTLAASVFRYHAEQQTQTNEGKNRTPATASVWVVILPHQNW